MDRCKFVCIRLFPEEIEKSGMRPVDPEHYLHLVVEPNENGIIQGGIFDGRHLYDVMADEGRGMERMRIAGYKHPND